MLKSIINFFVSLIGKIKWKARNEIDDASKQKIRELLKPNYYIIVSRRSNHLSTYFINLADFLLSGHLGYWSHVLMNLEDTGEPILIEALGVGVKKSTFEEVFNCTSVALLKPRSMNIDQWTAVLDKAKTELGKPYDTLFDYQNDSKLSCVELVRDALMGEKNYATDFARFESMISSRKNLTPQMFYDCPDFEVVFEVRG